jgi:hypothetical protein
LALSGCISLRTITLTAPPTDAACPAGASAPTVSTLDPTGNVAKAAQDAKPYQNAVLQDSQQHQQAAVSLLNDAFLSVRYETLFVPLVKPTFENPDELITEASTLVKKARAQAAVTKDQPLDPKLAPSDPTEALILSKLPKWAGQPSSLFPLQANIDQLRANANAGLTKIRDDSFTIFDLASRHSQQRNRLITTKGSTTGDPTQTTTDTGGDLTVASINRTEHDTILDSLETLAGYRAFHVLTLISAAHLYEMLKKNPLPDLNTLNGEVRIFNLNRYLSTYFDAYFRGGQFIQFTADQKAIASTLTTDLQKRVKSGLQPAEVSQFITDEFTKLCQGQNNTSVCASQLGQTAFVTRAGLSVQFSGISFAVTTTNGLGLSHNYPQLSQFGPQMIRVLVEALFDANGLSAKSVPNSTECVEGLIKDDCLTANDTAGQATLEQIDMIASALEALNSTATGVLIRGLNEAALNNEAVSQSIETLIGVTARKLTERVLYSASLQQKAENTCPVPVPKMKVHATDSLVSQ